VSIGLVVSAATAISVATASYIGTYANTRLAKQRSDRIERLSAQLRDLYGPLAALLTSTDALYNVWRTRQLPVPAGWKNSSEEEREEWRHWMMTVFMPLNRRMSQIVTTHADLIEEGHMPPELIALCAHVESYEALQARWEAGNFERFVPHIMFPDVVIDYAIGHFNALKSEQARLLGRRRGLGNRKTASQQKASSLAAWEKFKEQYAADYFRDAQEDEDSPFA
jgi:hypothetical protein